MVSQSTRRSSLKVVLARKPAPGSRSGQSQLVGRNQGDFRCRRERRWKMRNVKRILLYPKLHLDRIFFELLIVKMNTRHHKEEKPLGRLPGKSRARLPCNSDPYHIIQFCRIRLLDEYSINQLANFYIVCGSNGLLSFKSERYLPSVSNFIAIVPEGPLATEQFRAKLLAQDAHLIVWIVDVNWISWYFAVII